MTPLFTLILVASAAWACFAWGYQRGHDVGYRSAIARMTFLQLHHQLRLTEILKEMRGASRCSP